MDSIISRFTEQAKKDRTLVARVAAKTGISKSALYAYIGGSRKDPRGSTLEKLRAFYDASDATRTTEQAG